MADLELHIECPSLQLQEQEQPCKEQQEEAMLEAIGLPFVGCYRCQEPIAIWDGAGPWFCGSRCKEQQQRYGSAPILAKFTEIYRITHQFFPVVCGTKGARNVD
jgi:hypothetical protein